MKTGNSVGQRRYENSCVKLAFTLYGYSKALETSNHFCMSSSKDCSTCSPRSGLLTSETKRDMKCIDLSKLCLEQIFFFFFFFLSVIDIYCFRVALTQLRLGVLPINSSMYRYSDCHINNNCILPKPG